jgi:DnaJ-class molecular chaperone
MQNSKQPSSTIVPGIWTAEQFEFGFIKHLPPVRCPICDGKGAFSLGGRIGPLAMPKETCTRCHGSGWVDGRRP